MAACPKCGAEASVSARKVRVRRPWGALLACYAVLLASTGYLACRYGTMPVTAGGGFQAAAFAALFLACLVGFPVAMSFAYRPQEAEVLSCPECGHAEVSSPARPRFGEWDLRGPKG